MGPADVTSILGLLLFEGLDEADAASFAEHAAAVALPAGEVLFRQGDAGSSLYFLLDGQIEVMAGEGGTYTHRLAVLEPGAILGEVAVLTDAPRTATAVALTDARLWEVDDRSFHAGLDGSQRWAAILLRRIACVLAERLTTVDRRLLSLIAAERANEEAGGGGRVAELERLRQRLLSEWTF